MSGTIESAKLFDCPVLVAIRLISGKWKTRILWLLRERPYHFGELSRTLPGISSKVLDEQLGQLSRDGLIVRREEMQGGLKFVYYAYTPYGRSLIPALDALGNWGLAHAKGKAHSR